jgi:nicotinate-nucleotide--dimethylbenzimidazole phosphoribosyltransferase
MPKAFPAPEDFREALANLPRANAALELKARRHQDELTKPPGSLGRLEQIAVHLAGWQADGVPRAERIKVAVFAGNHGVTAQGVSPYPAAVTAQMVANFEAGGAAINAITGSVGLELEVVVLQLDKPTDDITRAPAMSVAETLDALNAGAAVVGDGFDILILGEMGIGNTTIAAALCAGSLGEAGAAWVGPGTGHDAQGIARKAAAVDQALARAAREILAGPFATLQQLGGRETAAIAGAVVAARRKRIPVILDGYVVTASLVPLFAQNPAILEHCIAGHESAEPAHRKLLQKMQLSPLLNLGMRLGEGTGAALAAAIVRAAVATHTQMATFGAAAVENRLDAE